MSARFVVPASFEAYGASDPVFAAYLDGLPRLVREVLDEWRLTPDGPAWHGRSALVLPVRTSGGGPAALKLGFPHDEAEHEHLALQRWQGNGAVRLLRADPRRSVLLLERVQAGEDLGVLRDVEACEVVAVLYGRLHVPALPQLRRLSSYVSAWTDRLAQLPRTAPVPRRLVEQAVSLGRRLTSPDAMDATDARMIHGDLHYANVLAADREPWLVIDPKPVAGDPHYELAPMLWNRWEEVVASGDVRAAVRRRFLTLVDAAVLDEDRARDWVVVRMLHNVLFLIEAAGGERLGREAADEVTAAIAIAKAVQG